MTTGSLWDKIGTTMAEAVEAVTSIVETALKAAGIDFTAVKKPLWGGDLDGVIKRVPNWASIVKEGSGDILGVTSDRYGIVQNAEGFAFADYIDGLKFLRGGITTHGLNWLIGAMPSINILGDVFTPHIVFQNSFNGRFQLKAAVVLLRDGTDTQYRFAIGSSSGQIKIRHSKNAKDRLETAHEAMLTVSEFAENTRLLAEELNARKVDPEAFINVLFPITDKMTETQEVNVRARREAFKTYLKNPVNARFGEDSGWALFNAYADYLTHESLKDGFSVKKAEKAFERSLDPKKLTEAVKAIKKLA